MLLITTKVERVRAATDRNTTPTGTASCSTSIGPNRGQLKRPRNPRSTTVPWPTCEQRRGRPCDEIAWLSEEPASRRMSSSGGRASRAGGRRAWFWGATTESDAETKEQRRRRGRRKHANPLSEDYDRATLLDVLWSDAMGDVISSVSTGGGGGGGRKQL